MRSLQYIEDLVICIQSLPRESQSQIYHKEMLVNHFCPKDDVQCSSRGD